MFLSLSWRFCFLVCALYPLANGQEIHLESSIVRCSNDEALAGGSVQNPTKLATSTKGHVHLDLKLYSKCRKKMLITLRITEPSEHFHSDALIIVDQAENKLIHKSSRLGRPLAVKFHQGRMLQKYSLQYLYRVNGKAWEEVINFETQKNFSGCDNSVHAHLPTCGFLPNTGDTQIIPGFCCTCQDHRDNVQQRGGHRCDTPNKSPVQLTSAHCFRTGPFSYNVYEVGTPVLFQQLRFEVYKSQENANGSISWKKMSENPHGVAVTSVDPLNASGMLKVERYHFNCPNKIITTENR